MREILFRGKRKDNGEWVYGDLFNNYNYKKFIGELIINDYKGAACDRYEIGTSIEECITSTVGQYTGLTDKNGKKIFEGDMIKPFDDEIDKMVVEFCHGQFLLCLYGERGYMAEYGWEESGNYGCFEAEPLSSYGDDIEIIGNIHDNPELLKEGDGE